MRYKRRLVREKTLQALYALELSNDPIDHILSYTIDRLCDDKESHAFARSLFQQCVDAKPAIDLLIREQAAHWEFERIALIDKLLLRMTIAELMFFEEIPPKVSINEAIEIAKRFSTEKSSQFVNGILDAIFERLKKENKLRKSGRGLIDMSVNAVREEASKNKTT